MLIAALVTGIYVAVRDVRVGRLSKDCTGFAAKEDWPRLEVVAREWTNLQSAPVAWFWLGTSLNQQRRFAEAKQAFENVPLDGLRGIDAATARLEIQYHVEQLPLPALELAHELLRRDPRLASPRRHLIHFYAMTFQRAELIRQVRLAIDCHADIPDHYLYLFSVEDLSFRDAEQVTARWAEAAPESHLLRQVHAMHRLRNARAASLSNPTPEQTEKYRRIRDETVAGLEPNVADSVVLDTLLLLAMDTGDVDEAGRLLGLVPETVADDPVFWRYRGWYATRNGDHAQAADSYRQALALHPLGWQTRHEYATFLRLTGQTEAAGKEQSIAALGSELANDVRRLPHVQNASPKLMLRMATFARECGDWKLANGIVRRYETGGQKQGDNSPAHMAPIP